MPTIKKFKFKNFKGIEETEIELSDRTSCPVITLVGLNESGKTTILEGMSHFVSGDKSVAALFDGPHAQASGAGLIPVNKKAAFTAEIEITALVQLDASDVDAIVALGKTRKYDVDGSQFLKTFEVSRKFKFEDSLLKRTYASWWFSLRARKQKNSPYKPYKRPTVADEDLWLAIASLIEVRLPQIAYFPTFLVDMPAKIYLREHEQEKAVNRHYRCVFQDILDSLGEGLSLEKHVSNRIAEFKAADKSANWYSSFLGGPTKAPIDSVFQKISNAVTGEVLGSWQRVFQRAISAKSIFVEWNIDAERGDIPYASFYVSDGESRYAISERSLGFRWFFSFLLFTAFKQAKQRKTIFVFDEPAANLHAKAQAELLTSFSKIATDGNKVIYSTHSHHMINPRWLGGAYIVENKALDYDAGDSFALNTKQTNVKATGYRQFVSAYPNRSSYFQPVIEKLEYVTPEIIGAAPYLIVEGISDFYALRLAQRISGTAFSFSVLPGVGSGACGPLISQFLGRGERFAVMLDDDKAGRKEAGRYKDEWFLDSETIHTLAVVDPVFSGKKLEGLLDADTLDLIKIHSGAKDAPSKKQIGWYLAECCALESPSASLLSEPALKNLLKVLEFYSTRLA